MNGIIDKKDYTKGGAFSLIASTVCSEEGKNKKQWMAKEADVVCFRDGKRTLCLIEKPPLYLESFSIEEEPGFEDVCGYGIVIISK